MGFLLQLNKFSMRKNSLFAIDSTATCLPWWTWFVLAGLSYLLLSWIAGIEIMTGTITDPKTMIWPYTLALLKGAAFLEKCSCRTCS
ncbi:MAG: hypothetical protein ACTFAL_00315 [Candidatus Electronema sp. V4]|uniref:hypothetical protein n=1 Tax=Candidatus Electronema sp. V4 TaxID=3454756 RepID=UPI0040554FE4